MATGGNPKNRRYTHAGRRPIRAAAQYNNSLRSVSCPPRDTPPLPRRTHAVPMAKVSLRDGRNRHDGIFHWLWALCKTFISTIRNSLLPA